MMRQLSKLILIGLLIGIPRIGKTNAAFVSNLQVTGITISTGCWIKPAVPTLLSPSNDYVATINSAWIQNPVMDWSDVTPGCPGAEIRYQYESYYDAGLTQLAYQSNWLTDSMIPAPNTPDGVYYWHVRAMDSLGNVSDFSPAWKLTVDRTPIETMMPLFTHTLTLPSPSPSPTPEPLVTTLELSVSPDKETTGFTITGDVTGFTEADYTITYESGTVDKTLVGIVPITGDPPITKDGLVLGTCSTNGCTYDDNIKWIKAEVILKGTIDRTLNQELDF